MSIPNPPALNGAPFERIIMGPGTPFQTVIREENLNNCIAQLSDALITDLLLKRFEFTPLTSKIFTLSQVTPTIGSLLVFPCFGEFVGEEDGSTPNARPLLVIMDNEQTAFEMEDPEQGWILSDFIDHIGCYVVLITETELVPAELSIANLPELIIKGKLVFHLEPCVVVEHSIRTSICFNIGMEVSLSTFPVAAADQEGDNASFGAFIVPTSSLEKVLYQGGYIPAKKSNPIAANPELVPLPPKAHRTVDGEIIYCHDRTKFGTERKDCLGFMRAYACVPEKKSLLVGGVPDEHRLSEDVVSRCLAIVDTAAIAPPSFAHRSYISRLKNLPVFMDKEKLLTFMKFNFSVHDLSALSPADFVPINHVINISGFDKISFTAMVDAMRLTYILMLHDGYSDMFKHVKDEVDFKDLAGIPDKVLYVCLLFAWGAVCAEVHDQNKPSSEWKTDRNKLPNLFKFHLAEFFEKSNCERIWRTWDEKYEGKYPITRKRSLPAEINSDSKAAKLGSPAPPTTDFCLTDLYFKYNWVTANAKKAGKATSPCKGTKCVKRHIELGKFPPKADVIAWLTKPPGPGLPVRDYLQKFADHVATTA